YIEDEEANLHLAQEALEEATKYRKPPLSSQGNYLISLRNLCSVRMRLARYIGGRELLDQCESDLKDAVALIDVARTPLAYVETLEEIASLHRERANHFTDTDEAKKNALQAAREALGPGIQLISAAREPLLHGRLQSMMAESLIKIHALQPESQHTLD